MVASPKGRRPEKDCAGEGQQHTHKTVPTSHQRGASQKQDCNSQTVINISWGSTSRLTDWPTISRNVTLTLSNLALFADDSVQGGLHSQKTPTWPGVSIGTLKINEDKAWAIYFPHWIRPPESLLTLNGLNIPFVNSVKYLGVIFDRKITGRPHRKMIKTKAFRTFIRVHALFKSERLSTNIKLTLHKALMRSVMTQACSIWEFVADTLLIKLQCLEDKVLHTIGNFPRRTPVREMQMHFH
jgi:hypothetical protein